MPTENSQGPQSTEVNRYTTLKVVYRAWTESDECPLLSPTRLLCDTPFVSDNEKGAFMGVTPRIISDEGLLRELQSLEPDDSWHQPNLMRSEERRFHSAKQKQGFNIFNFGAVLSNAHGVKRYQLKTHSRPDGTSYAWDGMYHAPIEVSYNRGSVGYLTQVTHPNTLPKGGLTHRITEEIASNLFTIINCNASYKVEMGFTLQTVDLGSCSEEIDFQSHTSGLISTRDVISSYGHDNIYDGEGPSGISSASVETLVQRLDEDGPSAGFRYHPEGIENWEKEQVVMPWPRNYSVIFANNRAQYQEYAGGNRGDRDISITTTNSLSNYM